eukprot:745558-Amphidinium_carterae.1
MTRCEAGWPFERLHLSSLATSGTNNILEDDLNEQTGGPTKGTTQLYPIHMSILNVPSSADNV